MRLPRMFAALTLLMTGAVSCRDTQTALLNLEPVKREPHTTARDLLRGFTEAELTAAAAALPPRPDPPRSNPVPRQVTVNGQVYEDTNQNGRRDAGDKGLPGVLVSDGERIVRTGEEGRFSFDFAMGRETHHRFVFANRPTGYRPTSSFFQRVGFDETATDYQADFAFAADEASRSETFEFLTTSDTQFQELEWMIPTAKDYAQMTGGPNPPAFLVTVGDLTDGGSHYQWDMYDFIRGASRVTVYDGFGGHDGNVLKPRSTEYYEARIAPPYYSWDYGGVHFIQMVTELVYLQPEAQERQRKWLEADFEAVGDRPVIVSTHYPLPAEWFDERRAAGTRIIGQLAGHFHTVSSGSRNGVPVMMAAPANRPDWGAYGRPYRRVRVSPQGVTSELRIAGQYQRLDLLAPGPEALLGEQTLLVLAYDSVRTAQSVSCRITSPQGASRQADLVRQGDWSWYGRFDADQAGTWRFDLQASGADGTIWQESRSIQVENRRPAEPAPGADFPWILAGNPPRRLEAGVDVPLYPLWVRHTGSVHARHATPAVAGGRVFVAVTNPNAGAPGSGVLCLDARSGKEIWRAPSPLGDIPGPVTVQDGRVYALTGEGWVGAWEAETGKVVWQTPLDEDYRQGRPLASNYTMPVPTPRGVLVSERLRPPVLLDYRTGKLTQLEGHSNPGQYAPFVTVFDGVIYSGQRLFRFAQSLSSERPLWAMEDEMRHASAGVLAGGKYIYTGCCRLQQSRAPRSNLVTAVDAKTGAIVWETVMPNPAIDFLRLPNTIPVAWDDLVLVNGAEPIGLDLETGKIRWTIPLIEDAALFERSQRQVLGGASSPLLSGELALFGHDDTFVKAVTKEGRVIWQYRVGTPVNTSPAASGNLLFVHDFAGNLWCFAPAAAGQ